MCVSDWRLGQYITPNLLITELTSFSSIPANPLRVGLLISVQFDPVADQPSEFLLGLSNTVGMWRVSANNSPYLMTIQDHGVIVQRQIFMVNSQQGGVIDITEFVMPHEMLAAQYQQFESEYSKWLKQNYP